MEVECHNGFELNPRYNYECQNTEAVTGGVLLKKM